MKKKTYRFPRFLVTVRLSAWWVSFTCVNDGTTAVTMRLFPHQSLLLISSSNWQMLKQASNRRHWSALLSAGDAQLMPWRRRRRAGEGKQTGRRGDAVLPVRPAWSQALMLAPDRSPYHSGQRTDWPLTSGLQSSDVVVFGRWCSWHIFLCINNRKFKF